MSLLKASKIRIHLLIRSLQDAWNQFIFASKAKTEITYTHSIEISQEIKPSATFENKVYNLVRAATIINEYDLMPGEVFSFWRIIKIRIRVLRKAGRYKTVNLQKTLQVEFAR